MGKSPFIKKVIQMTYHFKKSETNFSSSNKFVSCADFKGILMPFGEKKTNGG